MSEKLSRELIEQSIKNMKEQQVPGSSPLAAAIEAIMEAYEAGYTPGQISEQIKRDTGQDIKKETIARYIRGYRLKMGQEV